MIGNLFSFKLLLKFDMLFNESKIILQSVGLDLFYYNVIFLSFNLTVYLFIRTHLFILRNFACTLVFESPGGRI